MAETAAAVSVVDMLDAIGVSAGSIPKGTKRVAIYLTGSGGIAWTNADVATLTRDDPQLQAVFRIDQANQSTNIFRQVAYLVIDIEPGAATLPEAIRIAAARHALGLRTCFYYFKAEEGAVLAAVAAAGLAIDFWLADWNLTRAEAVSLLGQAGKKAIQWASPTSNPNTLVPGTNRTLAQANIDLSVTLTSWPTPVAVPVKKKKVPLPPKPHIKVTAGGIGGSLAAALLAYLNSKGAHITHLDASETSGISLLAAGLAAYLTPSK